jgi:hypothetical protein
MLYCIVWIDNAVLLILIEINALQSAGYGDDELCAVCTLPGRKGCCTV